ncbi:solute carrier family 46 member 2 [Ambystoma mexicanum]|uniref:solute carrier family 46 member 2 n=1 Tax=Ambystoma mexicanum TaxID=8296 RepID=UPI0037E797B5
MACVLAWRSWVEPVVAGAQLASSFYDTGLLMVVKNYYNTSNSSAAESAKDAQQKAISNFYIIYNLLFGLCPLLSAYALGWLGDRRHRKITICVPLLGYLVSRLFLLLVILLEWPIEVMYGSAALNGLTGAFTTYWAGIMALGSLGSTERGRSLRLIVIELTYGVAGFVGSMASGHLFINFSANYHQGTVLVSCSLACYLFCLMYSIFVLKVPGAGDGGYGSKSSNQADGEASRNGIRGPQHEKTERTRLLEGCPERTSSSSQTERPSMVTPSKVIIALFFISAILYNLAVLGSVDVLPFFLIKDPLNWGPVYIGYGNAAGYVIFVTSFLGVFFFSKYLRDTTLIMIGVVSFSAGILIMAFARWTFIFYIARGVMLFSLIPLPIIRSSISKQVEGSSYGKVFVILQLVLTITAVVTSTVYNKIYQATLDWFSGFCFVLSCVISTLSIIPISVIAFKQSLRPTACTISEDQAA